MFRCLEYEYPMYILRVFSYQDSSEFYVIYIVIEILYNQFLIFRDVKLFRGRKWWFTKSKFDIG